MSKYRKKPVVIEAFQMTKERRQDNSDWPEWLREAWSIECKPGCTVFPEGGAFSNGKDNLFIATLEGMHKVDWNDWIIQGVKGELYPCKPDIFEQTYEAI